MESQLRVTFYSDFISSGGTEASTRKLSSEDARNQNERFTEESKSIKKQIQIFFTNGDLV